MRWLEAEITLLGAGALLAVAAPAPAQDTTWSVEGRIGIASPGGELLEVVDPGPSFGLGVAYRVAPRIALRADGTLNLLSGVEADAGGPAGPYTRVWHYTGGLSVRILDPARTRWTVEAGAGAGATTFDSNAFTVDDRPTSFWFTYFTATGSLRVGYDATPRLNLHAFARAYWIATDEEDTQVFSRLRQDVDPGGFGAAWTFPIGVGAAYRVP